MAVSGKSVVWSPQGWLLNSPDNTTGTGGQKLSFAQISYAIMDTVKEAQKLKGKTVKGILTRFRGGHRRHGEKQDRRAGQTTKECCSTIYFSWCATASANQLTIQGQMYNSNPTPQNEQNLNNFDMIVGKLHTNLLRLMMQHSEGEFEVDAGQQRQYLLKEMNEALVEVPFF
jgi:hypothetical protein